MRILLHILYQIRSKAEKYAYAFGVGVNQKWIAVHRLAHSLSPPKCRAFPSWYTLTGCDTVSSFHGKRKVSLGDLEMLSQGNRDFSSIIKPC